MGSQNSGAEYGYVSGILLLSPGYLRITVEPETARVDYISTVVPGVNQGAGVNEAVTYSYTLAPSPEAEGV